jgi:hypothetical protein
MAVMFVHGPCVACRCESCFHQWNEIHRTRKGLDPLPLHPKAYEPKVV